MDIELNSFILEHTVGNLYWKDTNGRYLACNRKMLVFAGKDDISEVVGKTDRELLLPVLGDEIISNIESIDQEVMNKEIDITLDEFGMNDNGEWFFFITQKMPLRDKHQNVIGLVGNSISITPERYFGLKDCVINGTSGNLYWKDRAGRYLGCNMTFAKIARLNSPQDILGKNDADLFYDSLGAEKVDLLMANDQEIMSGGVQKTIEEIGVDVNGNETFYITEKKPLYNRAGTVNGIIGMSIDISDLKKTQKALEIATQKSEVVNKEKSEFIANMSHDVRTPIAGILGMFDGVNYASKDAKAALPPDTTALSPDATAIKTITNQLIASVEGYANIGHQATNELMVLFSEILEVTRLESGEAVNGLSEDFNLIELVQHNLDLLASVADAKGLLLSAEIAPTVVTTLHGVRHYLDRTLLNLLSNALKFTKDGSVTVTIDSVGMLGKTLGERQKTTLQIQVRDTGIGIPESKFDLIFEHYFARLMSSYQGHYKGSGLGLYAVKRYVTALGGTIQVESQLGQGSCFTVTVSFLANADAQATQRSTLCLLSPQTELIATSPLRTPPFMVVLDASVPHADVMAKPAINVAVPIHVLLVEDSPIAAMAVKTILTSLQCTVDTVATGEAALGKLEKGHYNIILMDVGLPDMDGMEVAQRIRVLETPGQPQIPIIALTGHAHQPDVRLACLGSGMNDILAKPAKQEQLDAVLNNWVHTARESIPCTTPPIHPLPDWAVRCRTTELPIIDWPASLAACGGDAKTTRDLLIQMLHELGRTQRMLAGATVAQDILALREELHRCLGGVVYLKLPQLEACVRMYQRALKAKPENPIAIKMAYAELDRAILAFEDTIKQNEFDWQT